jgi:hypothetical protein
MEEHQKEARNTLSKILAVLAWICFPIYLIIFVGNWFFMRGFGRFIKLPWWDVALKTLGAFVLLSLIIRPFREDLINFFGRKNIGNTFKKRWLSIFSVFLIVTSLLIYWHESSYKGYVSTIFKEFVCDPVPQRVRIVRADVFAWLDFFASMEFIADAETFNKIIDIGKYRRVNPPEIDKFVNEFSHRGEPGFSFYYKEKRLSDKAFDACYLSWNSDKNTAYLFVTTRHPEQEQPGSAVQGK